MGWYERPCSLWAMDGARLDVSGCKGAKSHCRQCYASDTNGSDDTFENTQLRKVKHKCYSSDTNGSSGLIFLVDNTITDGGSTAPQNC